MKVRYFIIMMMSAMFFHHVRAEQSALQVSQHNGSQLMLLLADRPTLTEEGEFMRLTDGKTTLVLADVATFSFVDGMSLGKVTMPTLDFNNRRLTGRGFEAGQLCLLYDASGRLVTFTRADNMGYLCIEIPAMAGSMIFKTDNSTIKFFIK